MFSFVSSSLISCANSRQTDLKWYDSSSGGKPSGSVFVSTATKLQPSTLAQPHMYTGTVLTVCNVIRDSIVNGGRKLASLLLFLYFSLPCHVVATLVDVVATCW